MVPGKGEPGRRRAFPRLGPDRRGTHKNSFLSCPITGADFLQNCTTAQRNLLICDLAAAETARSTAARLLIPVLGFLFHISEIQYFSGFLRFLRNSFFLHRNSSLFLFYFWSQNSNQDSCRNSCILRDVGISTSVQSLYSDGLPIV